MLFFNYSVKFITVTVISYFIYNIIHKYKKKEIVYKIYNHEKRFFLKWKKNTKIKMLPNFVNYLVPQPEIYNHKKRFFLEWKKNTEIKMLPNFIDYLVKQPKQEILPKQEWFKN